MRLPLPHRRLARPLPLHPKEPNNHKINRIMTIVSSILLLLPHEESRGFMTSLFIVWFLAMGIQNGLFVSSIEQRQDQK